MEISLRVNGELAEAVAEVFSRHIPAGVVIESTAVTADEDDEGGQAIGPLIVRGYLPLDQQYEQTRQKIEEGLWYLSRIAQESLGQIARPLYRKVEEVNWVESWKKHYHPIPIGQRLMIVPAWLDVDTGQRLQVRIEPGMAFGTGTHPTTQLCLEIAEAWFEHLEDQQRAPVTAMDIGCGSGILAIAALKLGAHKALGVDIDSLAITASRQNAEMNGVGGRLELGIGSVEEVRQGNFSLRAGHIVFANILAPILHRLLDAGLADLLTPGGILILSGILEEQSADLQAASESHGLRLVERRQSGDWVALGMLKDCGIS